MNDRERELYLEYKRTHAWATADYAMAVARALAYAEGTRMEWTKCLACAKGVLLPLSDYSTEGAAVIFKAWACSNKACCFTLRIDKGQVSYEEVR